MSHRKANLEKKVPPTLPTEAVALTVDSGLVNHFIATPIPPLRLRLLRWAHITRVSFLSRRSPNQPTHQINPTLSQPNNIHLPLQIFSGPQLKLAQFRFCSRDFPLQKCPIGTAVITHIWEPILQYLIPSSHSRETFRMIRLRIILFISTLILASVHAQTEDPTTTESPTTNNPTTTGNPATTDNPATTGDPRPPSPIACRQSLSCQMFHLRASFVFLVMQFVFFAV